LMVQEYDAGRDVPSLGGTYRHGDAVRSDDGPRGGDHRAVHAGCLPRPQPLGGWAMAFWIASFVPLLAMNVTIRQSEQLRLGLLFGFGLLVGVATAPTISYYANVDPEVVWEAGGATALFVAGFGAGGYARRPLRTGSSAVVGADRAGRIRGGADLCLDPGWLGRLRACWIGDLRWSGDVRLPAAGCHQGGRQGAVAGGLDFPRRLSGPPHAVRSEAPLTATTEPPDNAPSLMHQETSHDEGS